MDHRVRLGVLPDLIRSPTRNETLRERLRRLAEIKAEGDKLARRRHL